LADNRYLKSPGTDPSAASAEQQIDLLQQRLARAFQVRDFEAVLRCYAGDAVLLAPGRPPAHGQAAIALELRAAFSDPQVAVAVRTSRIEVSAAGDLAWGWGTGLTTITDPATGRLTTVASRWLAVYRRQADGWRIAADIFNACPEPRT
jgi:uncharacterized protein (TIGR02246 family)